MPHTPPGSVGLVEKRSLVLRDHALESGATLPEVAVGYETYGRLAPGGDNAILICHHYSGTAHAAGRYAPEDELPGYWDDLIGPGKAFDTDRYYVIASDALGNINAYDHHVVTTGPASVDPDTGRRYGGRFPLVTVGDLVRAQRLLLDRLGVGRLAAVVGGSLGGMQALEWAVRYPDALERAVVIAAAGRLGPQGIALNEVGRRAIMLDPRWQDGNYPPGEGPSDGLAIARMVGTVTYHSRESMDLRFGRRPASRPPRYPAFGGAFDVEGYLHHQGAALVARFDAHSYLRQTRAMDLYDVAAGYGSEEAALARVRARVLALGIRTDWLFPPCEVQALAVALAAAGVQATYRELDSPHGHDAFLKEWALLDPLLRAFLD